MKNIVKKGLNSFNYNYDYGHKFYDVQHLKTFIDENLEELKQKLHLSSKKKIDDFFRELKIKKYDEQFVIKGISPSNYKFEKIFNENFKNISYKKTKFGKRYIKNAIKKHNERKKNKKLFNYEPIQTFIFNETGIRTLCNFKEDGRLNYISNRTVGYKIKEGYRSDYETFSYSGKWSNKTGYNHFWTITAFAKVGRKFVFGQILNEKFSLKAPKGYEFKIDNFGLKICKEKNNCIDYHFDGHEVFKGVKYLIEKLKENEKRKKETAALKREEKQIEKIKLKEIFVFFKDSIKGGNCKAGTESYAKQHNINIKSCIRADVLKKINGNNRIEYAINSARIRTYKENKKGFCDLDIKIA